jgi:ribonuclease BN (tRNA processing enzyme)
MGVEAMATHRLTFFPLGNADCCRIDLNGGRQILLDYAAVRDPKDPNDLRCDLTRSLRDELQARKRDYYDAVGFTHLDDDHVHGASEFFHLEHAQKYQGVGRIKIRELWVPAAAIIEEGCEDESRIIRQEARYRLKQGKGIRVFSRPDQLKDWLTKQGLSLDDRKHLFTDAGQLVPGWTTDMDGVEFFVHSPFASRLEDGALLDRNKDSLVLHATFLADGNKTRVFFGADVEHEALTEIIRITRAKAREERLESDAVKIPHHTSYLSLGPEKGKDKTKPTDEIVYFYEKKLLWRATLVSTSNPIPSDDSNDQPPHRQAANYYREQAQAQGGEYAVTMEHPKASAPEPLVIEITGGKAKRKKDYSGGIAAAVSSSAPRAGRHG